MAKQKPIYGCVTLILGVIAVSALVVEGYEQNKCYCWDEMDSTLTEELKTKSVSKRDYKYTGIKFLAQGVYQACACSDVTRFTTAWTSDVEWGYDFVEEDPANIPILEKNITDNMRKLFDVTSPLSPFCDISFSFVKMTTSPNTEWTNDVVMKGREPDLLDLLDQTFKDLTGATDSMFSFSVLKCTAEPPEAGLNGIRTWTSTTNLPGDRAVYSCSPGYYIEDLTKAFSECQHSDLTWSSPAADLNCKRGCQDEPSIGTFFSTNDWKTSRRGEGEVVTYTCMNGYTSTTGESGSSTCKNSQWTPVDTTFTCKRIECPQSIPQTPAHCRSEWDGSLYIGTIVKYSCIEGYSSTVKGEIISECTDAAEWTPYPENFECVNNEFAIREGFYDDQMVQPYDYYEDSGITMEKTDESWFWIVTIPSMAAVLLLVLCCFCVTRTDSPAFVLCNKDSKYKYYQTA